MTDANQHLVTICAEALELSSPAERAAHLSRACGDDLALRREVEALLQAHAQVGHFLEPQAAAGATSSSPGKAWNEEATLPVATAEAAGAVIGRYKLLQPIGEGGMGAVWMAEQQEPVRRFVAVKLIKAGMDSKSVLARFEAERQALALMDHPNIARVLDGGATEQGRPYLVMELVKGQPLTRYCDEHKLTPRQRLELFVGACQAVQHAHQKGVIHRDLKPSNVLVAPYDGKPVVKVIDFGVAKAAGQRLTDRTLFTEFGAVVGTLEYMSPEQAELNNQDIDTRSDVYSLGVLLYELLTGTTPFTRKELEKAGMLEMLRVIREQEPTRPSTKLSTAEGLPALAASRGVLPAKLARLVRGELDWIAMRALEKDRNRSYDTANAFALDVQRYLADEPVLACPPSVGYRLRKVLRRNRATLMVAVGLLLALAVVAVSVGLSLRERAVRQAQVEGEVTLALRESERLQAEQKWPEALTAAKRAYGLVGAGPVNEELGRLAAQRVADLTLAAELEDILTDRLVRLADSAWSNLRDRTIDARYARAFRAAGIDVEGLAVEAAAELIRRRSVHEELAAALDNWAIVRMASRGRVDRSWRKLQALANTVDPDPFRVLIRKSVADPGPLALKRIVAAPEALDQPNSLLTHVVGTSFLVGPKSSKLWAQFLVELHRRHPGDFWINVELGTSSSNPVDALRFCTAAVAIRPRSAGAHFSLGAALERLGRPDDAIASYREALRLKRAFPEAQVNLGEALARKKRWDEAIACFKEAIGLQKDYGWAHHRLGGALAMKGQLDEAIPHLQNAVRLTYGSQAADARCALGKVLSQKGRWAEADAALRDALKMMPNDPDLNNEVAWFWATCPEAKFRNAPEAVRLARMATQLSPVTAGYWNTLGVARYRAGEWRQAVADLEKATQLSQGGDAHDWFFLAMAHWRLGDKEKARKWYEQAVRWTEKNRPQDEELKRFRTEAAELLGPAPPAGQKEGKK